MSGRPPLILAVETSCDESSLALMRGRDEVVASLISSQADLHAAYGGVVPEIAARKHVEAMNPLLARLFAEAGVDYTEVDAVAVTIGPGLVIALLVGLSVARAFAWSLDIPVIGVNHLDAHIAANRLDDPGLKAPYLAHVLSGGHTLMALVSEEAPSAIKTIGETVDDAVGEAFDKVAAFLGLPYPGGPEIDALARSGDEEAYDLPRAMLHSGGYNTSLSGVKTAVTTLVRRERAAGRELDIPGLCASFQAAVFEVQITKALRACKAMGIERIVLAGGVAANSYLRREYPRRASQAGVTVGFPPLHLCTDNAIMVAAAAYPKFEAGIFLPAETAVDPSLRLDDAPPHPAPPQSGPGNARMPR